MDLGNKPKSSEMSKTKLSGRANPHSSRSQQPNSSGSSNRNRNGNQGGNPKDKSQNSSDKRFPQRSKYRSKSRHHSHKSYSPEEYEHNRNNNYNSNRHYNSDRNRNSTSNRNPRWNSSGPRYGNRSWHRHNLNDSYHNPQSEHCSDNPPAHYESFHYILDNFVPDNNQLLDRAKDLIGKALGETFFQHLQQGPENQQLIDRLQGPTKRSLETAFHQLQQDPENQQFLARLQGSTERNLETAFQQLQQDPENHRLIDRLQGSTERRLETGGTSHKEHSQVGVVHFDKSATSLLEIIPGNENRNFPSQHHIDEPFEQRSDSQREQCFDEPAELRNNSIEETPDEFSALRTDNLRQEDLAKTFLESVPPILRPEDFIFNTKPELPDATDSDFELRHCLNVDTDHRSPVISVIPISRLIKSELQDLNRADIIAPTTPSRGRPALRPNLVQRRKKSGSISENLIQRVANMDKVGIKNVINNSGTKYDAALKVQARKRLREEIRKQLKSMNFTPPENSENSVLVPDEIVDSMNIPAVVLDEIRKAFGIVLVEDMKVVPNAVNADVQPPPASEEVTPAVEVARPTKEPSKSPDLMSRLKMLEELKSQSEKVSPMRTEVTPKKHSKSKPNHDVVVINSSSSSSSSSSSDSDSDTSSSSTGSNSSTTSSFKRRRRRKRILEANVVGNFEKLILPNLTDAQRRRYREKYSTTTKNSLLYIYGVCVSRANQNCNTVDPKEKLKLKRNLTSADNAQALEFLMKAILNLFEQHKEKRRKGQEKTSASDKSSSKSASKSKRPNPVSPTKKSKDSTCNQEKSDDEPRRELSGSATSAKSGEHQSTKVDEALPAPQPPPPLPEGGVKRNDGDAIAESANSAQGVSDGKLVDTYTDSDSDLDSNPPPRLWKSPGEKKCHEIETQSPLSGLGMLQPPLALHSFDLDSLKSQNSLGDEAVSNIREIDVKLMELHKRKMYIEEMILKLQKDKMEVDLWTMKLQNEKFILLNSALASASTSASTLVVPKAEKKTKPAVAKRKPFSTPFSEKLRNRKKRCQRDILLEDTDNAINGNQPQEKVSDISKLMLQPRRTRRSTQSSKVSENEQNLTIDTIKTDTEMIAKETVTAGEQDVPSKTGEVPPVDYTDVPNGNFEGWKLPITQIIVVGEAIVAASEDGNIYKFNIRTRKLESKFSKHTEAITQIFACPKENFVYTASLDGFLKKTSVENFGLEIQSLNVQEPLQSIDIEWSTAFIGSRWGNIFTYDIKNNNLSESLLCSSGSSIIAIKATKEGPRKILIVSSKGNQINFRDAMTGLLLRSLDVPNNLHIHSILLDDGCIFCGTQRNQIHQYNFTTGGRLAIFECGNGAVSMKMYKDKYIFVGCYDGFVYVLDKTTGCQIGRFPGSGRMILSLEIAGDKLITSAKDSSMQIIDIPKYIVTKDKS